jgi:hypothetical protein
MKVFCAAFMYLQFDLGAKAAHKMLVKLAPSLLVQPTSTR